MTSGPMDRFLVKRSANAQSLPPAKKTKTDEQPSVVESTSKKESIPPVLPVGSNPANLEQDDANVQVLIDSGNADELKNDEDEENGFDESDIPAHTSFSEDSQEVLAYLGVSVENANSWSEILLSLCVGLPMWEYLEPLREFLNQCTGNPLWRPTSLNPIDHFQHGQWTSHDATIDSTWETFIRKIKELSGNKIDPTTLSKPSGPLNAVLTTQWHYPTWFTQRPTHGSTMDQTNPSLRAQFAKLGVDAHVKTQDTLPIREGFVRGGIKWETVYDNWAQIKEECLKFTRWLNRDSKIILIVGEENVKEWRELVNLDDTVEAVQINLDIDFPVFGADPSFQIIRSKITKEIKQLVFFSYHSQYFFYRDISMRTRAYHDLIWNAVADWASIRPVKPSFFLRQSDVKQSSGNNAKKAGDKYGFTQLNLARKLRAQEKRTGVLFPEFVIRRAFRKTMNKNPTWSPTVDPSNGSWLSGIFNMWQQKVNATLATREYQMSEGGQRHHSAAVDTMKRINQAGVQASLKVRSSDEWKSTEGGKKAMKKLSRAQGLPKNMHVPKSRSLFRVKQVVDLLAAQPETLTPKQKLIRGHLEGWQSLTKKQQSTFFSAHVV